MVGRSFAVRAVLPLFQMLRRAVPYLRFRADTPVLRVIGALALGIGSLWALAIGISATDGAPGEREIAHVYHEGGGLGRRATELQVSKGWGRVEIRLWLWHRTYDSDRAVDLWHRYVEPTPPGMPPPTESRSTFNVIAIQLKRIYISFPYHRALGSKGSWHIIEVSFPAWLVVLLSGLAAASSVRLITARPTRRRAAFAVIVVGRPDQVLRGGKNPGDGEAPCRGNADL